MAPIAELEKDGTTEARIGSSVGVEISRGAWRKAKKEIIRSLKEGRKTGLLFQIKPPEGFLANGINVDYIAINRGYQLEVNIGGIPIETCVSKPDDAAFKLLALLSVPEEFVREIAYGGGEGAIFIVDATQDEVRRNPEGNYHFDMLKLEADSGPLIKLKAGLSGACLGRIDSYWGDSDNFFIFSPKKTRF